MPAVPDGPPIEMELVQPEPYDPRKHEPPILMSSFWDYPGRYVQKQNPAVEHVESLACNVYRYWSLRVTRRMDGASEMREDQISNLIPVLNKSTENHKP
jgi:hypothetical protein